LQRNQLIAFACLLIGSVVLACGVKPPAGEPPPSTDAPARAPALFATPKPLEQATVVGSIDGDTLVLSVGGRQVTTRLLLIDAPEADLAQCFAGAATAFVAAVLPPGSSVALERDQSDLDGLGRPLRYAYMPDGSMLNEQLVRGGFARVAPSPTDQ
jgi:micrococcal nuclease